MTTIYKNRLNTLAAHSGLILYTCIVLFPVFVVVINSFKTRKAIFRDPLALPNSESFSLIGYETVLKQGDFFLYFQNSMIVTVVSLFFILIFGAMAAFALAEYRFKGNFLTGLYLALGIMIPIRLGTVAILELMVQTGLVNTLWALILVYTAQGLPLAVFILSEFMKQVSQDLKDAGRGAACRCQSPRHRTQVGCWLYLAPSSVLAMPDRPSARTRWPICVSHEPESAIRGSSLGHT